MSSTIPLLESGNLSFTDNEWKTLLKIEAAPNRQLFIRDIIITFSDITTFQPRLRILFNGAPKIRDFPPNDAQVKLNFAGDFSLGIENKPPLEILVKSDGTNTCVVTAIVTGTQKQTGLP
jgi:hypothetical protein